MFLPPSEKERRILVLSALNCFKNIPAKQNTSLCAPLA